MNKLVEYPLENGADSKKKIGGISNFTPILFLFVMVFLRLLLGNAFRFIEDVLETFALAVKYGELSVSEAIISFCQEVVFEGGTFYS